METAASADNPLVAAGVLFLTRWFLFSALYWGLLKMQGLEHSFIGLLATTMLASAAFLVPWMPVGGGIAFVVAFIGIKAAARSKLGDVMFSGVVGGALMYVIALLLVAALENSRGNDTSAFGAGAGSGVVVAGGPDSNPRSVKTDGMKLIGVSVKDGRSLAVVQVGKQTESLGTNEWLIVRGGKEILRWQCEVIRSNAVVLRLNETDPAVRVTLDLELGLE